MIREHDSPLVQLNTPIEPGQHLPDWATDDNAASNRSSRINPLVVGGVAILIIRPVVVDSIAMDSIL